MNTRKFITACALLLGAANAVSQTAGALPRVEGEVRKVDVDAQKITLRHGEIPNIDMGAMTMVFRLKDPALLQQVKAGDKVTFTADKVDGALTVMSMDPVKP
ncbi:copper-binding protein [Variovorax sp. PAMC 28711]|uniref:copper-binding protein n=1 Tax=Variovorax sp. PAMC 28711 TaxID=1795631 RepID=UPI00078B38C9|nr:copper-binding protein [Variovorax sp. PAMC 28711]AMM26573.1 RND transporter [Variovorax sp. PAMC 28711]